MNGWSRHCIDCIIKITDTLGRAKNSMETLMEPIKVNNVNIKEPSITVVDVYLASSEDADYCGKTQRFTDQYSFLHHACILIINEETQNYNYCYIF